MARTKAYQGEGIIVHFEPARCIHAAECVHGLPTVFDAERRPWIAPGGTEAGLIADVVARCPSGALSYERTDGGPPEKVDAIEPCVRVVPDGPLYVQGMLEASDANGQPITVGPRAALCRCGMSKNKPYCDNSHVEAGFKG